MSGFNYAAMYYMITKEIEIYEMRLEQLQSELDGVNREVFTGKLPSDPMPVYVPLDVSLSHHDYVVEKIKETSAWLEEKQKLKKQIEEEMRGVSGIDNQVAYMRDIQNMPLQQIADELGYSLAWIKKVSQRVKRVYF